MLNKIIITMILFFIIGSAFAGISNLKEHDPISFIGYSFSAFDSSKPAPKEEDRSQLTLKYNYTHHELAQYLPQIFKSAFVKSGNFHHNRIRSGGLYFSFKKASHNSLSKIFLKQISPQAP